MFFWEVQKIYSFKKSVFSSKFKKFLFLENWLFLEIIRIFFISKTFFSFVSKRNPFPWKITFLGKHKKSFFGGNIFSGRNFALFEGTRFLYYLLLSISLFIVEKSNLVLWCEQKIFASSTNIIGYKIFHAFGRALMDTRNKNDSSIDPCGLHMLQFQRPYIGCSCG